MKLGETGSSGAAAAPAGSLGHLMLVNLPAVTEPSPIRSQPRSSLMLIRNSVCALPTSNLGAQGPIH